MDNGLLIEQVEKFKHLYDKQNSSFKNKLARENAWRSIGHILKRQAEQCEQRWNVLRNKYAALRRQLKQTPSGSQSFTISWPYFDCMKLLDPYIHSRVERISSIKQNTNSHSNHPQSYQWPGMYDILSPENIPDNLDSSQIKIEEELENITPEITPNAPNIQTERKNENDEEKPSKKKNTSDAVAESMSVAFTSSSDSLSSYVSNKNRPHNDVDSSDRAFADSIAADLSRVEEFAEKMYLKQQIYSLLFEYFRRVEREEV